MGQDGKGKQGSRSRNTLRKSRLSRASRHTATQPELEPHTHNMDKIREVRGVRPPF